MKVGIFFCTTERTQVKQLIKQCSEKNIACVGYHITRGWENLDGAEFQHHLQRITHMIIPINKTCLSSRWFSFLQGVAFGADVPMYYISWQHTIREVYEVVPHYARHHMAFDAVPELMLELVREQSIDYSVQQIEQAKLELTAMGYPLTESAMVTAVAEGIAKAVTCFLQTGFSSDTTSRTGVPLLNVAARNSHFSVMRLLLQAECNVNSLADDRGTTALMESAVQGDVEGVQLLLEYTPDVDLQSASGQTALMMAIGEGQEAIAEMLLDCGARTDIVDALGMTAYKYAKLFQHDALVQRIGT